MAHSTDYQSRTRRCPHPSSGMEQIAPNLRRCTACGRWSGTLDSEELMRLFYPPGVPREVVNEGKPWKTKAPRSKDYDHKTGKWSWEE